MALRRTALGLTLATLVTFGAAAAAEARSRCCFALQAVSTGAQYNDWTDPVLAQGQDRQVAHWRIRGLFRYNEQSGFGDLVPVSLAHNAAVWTAQSNVMSNWGGEPEPVYDPEVCGVSTKKSAVHFPRVDLFRGKLELHSYDTLDEPGCVYGHAGKNFDTIKRPHNATWGMSLPAPPARFFRRERRGITKDHRAQGEHADPAPDLSEHSTHEGRSGEVSIVWFPREQLERKRKKLKRYHRNYRFEDLCRYISPADLGREDCD